MQKLPQIKGKMPHFSILQLSDANLFLPTQPVVTKKRIFCLRKEYYLKYIKPLAKLINFPYAPFQGKFFFPIFETKNNIIFCSITPYNNLNQEGLLKFQNTIISQ